MRWPTAATSDSGSQCARLHQWLSHQDALPEAYGRRATHSSDPTTETASDRWGYYQSSCSTQAAKLRHAKRPLFWLESTDVATTRAIFDLAKQCSGTIHIAESPGARNVAAITSTSGWSGTTLAEVHRRADTIVHVGDSHLHDMPRLFSRFLTSADQPDHSNRKHWFVGRSSSELVSSDTSAPSTNEVVELSWPRDQWLDLFTQLLCMLREPQASLRLPKSRCNEAQLVSFADQLTSSEYVVFVWPEDEFSDELDRLVVQRLLELSQLLSQSRRCSLLPLSSDAGRITSREALLWLTNVTPSARYVAGQWVKPQLGNPHTLSDWEDQFDWIMCVRTLPSDRPLPDLRCDWTLDAACNCSRGQLAFTPSNDCLPVATLGVDGSGHLMRLDHGFVAHIPAALSPSLWPTAGEVLTELARQFHVGATP